MRLLLVHLISLISLYVGFKAGSEIPGPLFYTIYGRAGSIKERFILSIILFVIFFIISLTFLFFLFKTIGIGLIIN